MSDELRLYGVSRMPDPPKWRSPAMTVGGDGVTPLPVGKDPIGKAQRGKISEQPPVKTWDAWRKG